MSRLVSLIPYVLAATVQASYFLEMRQGVSLASPCKTECEMRCFAGGSGKIDAPTGSNGEKFSECKFSDSSQEASQEKVSSDICFQGMCSKHSPLEPGNGETPAAAA